MATDYISREDAIQCSKDIAYDLFEEGFDSTSDGARIVAEWIKCIPAADVVSREAFDRILAENDDMSEQLAKIGKKPVDKMGDVRTYAKAEWVSAELAPTRMKFCSRCWARKPNREASFCPSCGADMRKVVKIEQVKEDVR